MKIEKIKQTLEDELRRIEEFLEDAIDNLDTWRTKVNDLSAQKDSCKAAIRALTGSETQDSQIVPTPSLPDPGDLIIEPGFEISKDGAGNTCLVPKGMTPASNLSPQTRVPTEVPEIPPIKAAKSVGGESFEKPEDLF